MHFLSHPTFICSFATLVSHLSDLSLAQTVDPYPVQDCSQQSFYNGYLACGNDLTRCCGAAEACCAGGCCPQTAICIYSGTSNEACCPLSDPSACGAAPPPSTATGPPSSGPSVQCVSADDDWYCPHGYTCENATGGCLAPIGGGGGGDTTTDAPSPTPAPTDDSTDTDTDTTESPTDTPTSDSGAGAPTPTATVAGAGSGTSPAASPTKSSSGSILRDGVLWAVTAILSVYVILL